MVPTAPSSRPRGARSPSPVLPRALRGLPPTRQLPSVNVPWAGGRVGGHHQGTTPSAPPQSVRPDARMHLLEHGPLSHPRLAGAPSPPALAPMRHETQAERSETVGGRKQGHGCPETSPPGGEEAPYLGTCSGLRLDRTPPPEAATQAKLWIPAAQGGPALAGPAGGGWRAWE